MSKGSGSIYIKLMQARKEIGFVIKENKKVNGQYLPVSYNAVIEKVVPALESAGIACITSATGVEVQQVEKGEKAQCKVTIEFIDVANPESRVSIDMFAGAFDSLDKAIEKAATKAQRKAFQLLFMLPAYEEGQEPDGDKEPIAPEKYTAISGVEVENLRALAKEIGVSEEVVAKAAGSDFVKIEQVPQSEYGAILARLTKRAEQLRSAAK